MIIQNNEHCFISGMTQSGKTFLSQKYLENVEQQIFVIDTKGAFNWKLPDKDLQIISRLKHIDRVKNKKIIYRPEWKELNRDYYNSFFEYCMMRRDCIIVVDEAMQICPSALVIPEWYKGALTRGMELNVSVWSLSQRPAKIPIEILSESTHYFIFRLNNLKDRARICENTGYNEFMEIPEKYSFWYFNTVKGERPVKAKLQIKG